MGAGGPAGEQGEAVLGVCAARVWLAGLKLGRSGPLVVGCMQATLMRLCGWVSQSVWACVRTFVGGVSGRRWSERSVCREARLLDSSLGLQGISTSMGLESGYISLTSCLLCAS